LVAKSESCIKEQYSHASWCTIQPLRCVIRKFWLLEIEKIVFRFLHQISGKPIVFCRKTDFFSTRKIFLRKIDFFSRRPPAASAACSTDLTGIRGWETQLGCECVLRVCIYSILWINTISKESLFYLNLPFLDPPLLFHPKNNWRQNLRLHQLLGHRSTLAKASWRGENLTPILINSARALEICPRIWSNSRNFNPLRFRSWGGNFCHHHTTPRHVEDGGNLTPNLRVEQLGRKFALHYPLPLLTSPLSLLLLLLPPNWVGGGKIWPNFLRRAFFFWFSSHFEGHMTGGRRKKKKKKKR